MKINLTYMRVFIAVFLIGLIPCVFGPSILNASVDKKTSYLIDNLIKVRTSLELYKAHHNGQLPSIDSFKDFQATLNTKNKSCPWRINNIGVNPFNGLNTVRFDDEPAGANKAGYKFDSVTGEFKADNDKAYAGL